MATRRWQSGAPAVTQVHDYVFAGTWLAAETVTFTIGSKSTTVVVGSTVIDTILDTLVAAWNALTASVYPEMAELTASKDGTTDFRLTSDTKGESFACTVSTNSASGTIDSASSSTGVVITANSGPTDWNTAANWSGATVPVDTDDVIVDLDVAEITEGLDQSTVQPASLKFVGRDPKIGRPQINTKGTAYFEYRETALKIGPTTCTIQSTGQGRVILDFGTDQVDCIVDSDLSRIDPDIEAIQIKGTHASNVLNVPGDADVAVAGFGGEVATFATTKIGQGNATVRFGSGCTLTTVTMEGGEIVTEADVTTLTQHNGTSEIKETAAVTNLVSRASAVCNYNSTGTLGGNPVVAGNAVLDFSGDPRTKTVANPIEVHGSGRVRDPFNTVTSLVIDYNQVDIPGLEIGANVRVTRGAVA